MIVIVDPDPSARARISGALPKGELTQEAAVVAEVEALVFGADAVFLGPGVDLSDALALAERLRVERPEVGLVLVHDGLDVERLQAALRAGVRDLLPSSFTPEQAEATLERVAAFARQLRGGRDGAAGAPDASGQRVITVFSSKGGVGKSFISVNLALALARRGPVALVDLDLQFGDLAIMLQLFPARTIHDAASATPNLDADALAGYLAEGRGGVKLLAAPFEPGLAETVAPDAVMQILRLLRRAFAYVVVDTPAALNEHVMAAIDESDRTVLVGSMDVPSIKNMKLALQTLSLLDVPREKIHLVLNRADSEVGLRVNEVEKTLGTRVEVAIPSGREVPLSINRGVPLMLDAPASPVAAALTRLATLVSGQDEPQLAPAGREHGWLRRRSR